ncbi:hypothetical protein [Thalassotalea euphylliae]|uniref:Uncharacterized protein n=1 Tax=Thalassotalea euphylliae TaxID=1655234 RepID=A0A3E0UJZ1_9GAMM|nr:hypothetical protein [Thalassotalea euphylliae]REL36963.1 hypothetical protein DXX92_17505 [Thalassotalea euphylliae]
MLYILLIKFTLFLLLCAWLTKRNNVAVKTWSDEQLISGLPHYLKLKKQTRPHRLTTRFLDVDKRISQIKSETAQRFSPTSIKMSQLNLASRKALVRRLLNKRQQAKLNGNSFAHKLLEQQIEKVVFRHS